MSRELTPEVPLTRRESDVLDELIQGQSNRQIGKNLFISEDTVKTHGRGVLRKLRVTSRGAAVARYVSLRGDGDA